MKIVGLAALAAACLALPAQAGSGARIITGFDAAPHRWPIQV